MRRLRCLIGLHRWEFRDVSEQLASSGNHVVWVIDTYARRCCHEDEGWGSVNRDIVVWPLEESRLLDLGLELDTEPLE